jgi:23S rRNA pseudouridine1911/1915/1917 synthase
MEITYLVYENNVLTIKEFLTLNHYSPALIKTLELMDNNFKVNGIKVKSDYALKNTDSLTVTFNDEIEHDKTLDLPINIVYEDDYLLVINKPAPLAVIGTGTHYEHNLSLMIANYYKKTNIKAAIHIVNRLDKDTNGLMMVAKHQYIHHLFSTDVSKITRKYRAIIEGVIEEKEGIINLPIKKKPGEREIRRMVDESGKEAITNYKTIDDNKFYSLLDISLKTGRTHQIRVHFSHLGHPLVGDELYGHNYDGKLRLQSYYLNFIHPITKQEITLSLKDEELLSLDSLNLSLDYLPYINLPLYQRKDMFRLNSDTSLLGMYLNVNSNETVLDIGTNNGALLMYANRFKPKNLIGVDIFEEALDLAEINFTLNNITNYQLIQKPIQDLEIENIDVIIANPPYFKMVDKLDTDINSFRFIARHEIKLTLEDIFIFVSKSLNKKGRFYLINRLSRLNEIKQYISKYNLSLASYEIEKVENKQDSEIRILITITK